MQLGGYRPMHICGHSQMVMVAAHSTVVDSELLQYLQSCHCTCVTDFFISLYAKRTKKTCWQQNNNWYLIVTKIDFINIVLLSLNNLCNIVVAVAMHCYLICAAKLPINAFLWHPIISNRLDFLTNFLSDENEVLKL